MRSLTYSHHDSGCCPAMVSRKKRGRLSKVTPPPNERAPKTASRDANGWQFENR